MKNPIILFWLQNKEEAKNILLEYYKNLNKDKFKYFGCIYQNGIHKFFGTNIQMNIEKTPNYLSTFSSDDRIVFLSLGENIEKEKIIILGKILGFIK